jgi:hypothetical protein
MILDEKITSNPKFYQRLVKSLQCLNAPTILLILSKIPIKVSLVLDNTLVTLTLKENSFREKQMIVYGIALS